MFKLLELENFKAFGERARIEFAPITLIFGENSAGKSTILQSLCLLKQSIEARGHGAPLCPRVEGGIVDLGSFRELLFDHDTDRTLSLRVDLANDSGSPKHDEPTPRRPESSGLEFRFRWAKTQKEVQLRELRVFTSDSEQETAVYGATDAQEGSP